MRSRSPHDHRRGTDLSQRWVSATEHWLKERRIADAAELCGEWPAPEQRGRRRLALCSVTAEALVLGSGQRFEVVDAASALRSAVDVVRRPAGGGAVFVAPGEQVWADVWLPRDDDLWDDDVVRSSRWVGAAWARALGALGVDDLVVADGPATCDRWSRLLCFAGVGAGEVMAGGAKVVGVAQRRGRDGARFLTMAHARWDPRRLVRLLALAPPEAERAATETAAACVGLEQLAGTSEEARFVSSPLTAVEEALSGSMP